jgi:polyisoprenoid-binding protein YceI
MMRMVSALVLALVATTATAQAPPVPGSRDWAAASGGRYSVDPEHTLVVWTFDHPGFTPYTGMFGGVTGTIRRSDFGLGFGVPMVGDEVKLEIAAAFQK